jgi:Family of unknown function (DUF5991)
MTRALAAGLSAGWMATAAVAAPPWDGTYLYEQTVGAVSGDIKLLVNHKLMIDLDNCRLDTEGYQTFEQIRCRATPNGDKLEVFFDRYDDDNGKTVNRPGAQVYEPNQKLFTLARKGPEITTEWADYSRNKQVGPARGDSFKKM